MSGEVWALVGAAMTLLAAIGTALFGRRNSKDSTDLQRIELLFKTYDERIDELKEEVATQKTDVTELKKEMEALRTARAEEKKTSERRIHALRSYVSLLLDFIAREVGANPPEPREPLD